MAKTINFLKILTITIIFFLVFDVTIGKYIYKKFVRDQLLDINIGFSKFNEVYDHTFPKNFNAIGGWGKLRYRLCTDDNGFKTSCNNNQKKQKNFDIAFIGDSFTEGLGYDYEKTFVGIIDNELKNKKVANLAMGSYSPSIYYAKINHLIAEGYKFKEVIVFIDISDFVDDILCYKLNKKNKIERKITSNTCLNNFNDKQNKFLNYFERNFNFTYMIIKSIDDMTLRKIDKGRNINNWNHSRSEWTYNYNKKIHNNLEFDEAISISKKHMTNLYDLLKKNSIDLSIAVYPWPGTLKYGELDNPQVITWKNFCNNKCKKFFNFMPFFFAEVDKDNFEKIYLDYYIKNDVHFNIKGNRFIAEKFLDQYLK